MSTQGSNISGVKMIATCIIFGMGQSDCNLCLTSTHVFENFWGGIHPLVAGVSGSLHCGEYVTVWCEWQTRHREYAWNSLEAPFRKKYSCWPSHLVSLLLRAWSRSMAQCQFCNATVQKL